MTTIVEFKILSMMVNATRHKDLQSPRIERQRTATSRCESEAESTLKTYKHCSHQGQPIQMPEVFTLLAPGITNFLTEQRKVAVSSNG